MADELTVEAWMPLNLITRANVATLKSFVPGDMSITQQGPGLLKLYASVRERGPDGDRAGRQRASGTSHPANQRRRRTT